jgi:3-oxoacyl-[acyl-carrier protein] reductase
MSDSTVKNVLITGANGGLGLAIARAFLEKTTHHVCLGVRQRRQHAEALQAEHPQRTTLVTLDVTQPSDWQAAVASIGTVSVLVNNAGHHDDALLATMAPTAWASVIESNLTSTFHGCQAVVRGMMTQRWGRIINISSLSALMAPAGQTNYAAAKAGLLGLAQSLSKEVARAQITVNTLCPGYIETEALADMDPEIKKMKAAQVPMRRFGRPAEIAAAVLFFASEDASYITGAELKIDGGIL